MKTAKFSRILSLLALVLVATMLLTLVSCGSTTPVGDIPAAEEDVSSDPSDGNGDVADPSVTDPSDTDPTSSDPTASDPTSSTPTSSGTGGIPIITKPNPSGSGTTQTTTSLTNPTVDPGKDVLKAVPKELKGTSIKMLIWWTAGKDDKAEAAKFEKATGIKVSYETAALTKYQTNLSAKVMAKNAPALAAIINEWYPQPITRGLMQPLTNVKGWNYKDSKLYSLSLMDQFGYKGKHYGVALKGSNMTTFEVMFFNKNILKKQGVKQDPYQLWKAGKWNWDTCLDIAKKCTDSKRKLFGMSNVGQYFWMLSAGEDFVKSTKAGLKNNIGSAGVLNAWNHNWNLTYSHKVIDTSYTGQTRSFHGKAAMLGAGSYMMQADASHSNYVPQNMKDEWGVVPFPSPKGKSVAACEGTVWGFPTSVSGNKLQAAAWYLRYFLDDYNYSARDFYPKSECWEVMKWMWDQTIQSYNSVGVLTYGGEYNAYSIQYSLVDEADTTGKLKANLESWIGVLDANIKKIENELA